MKKLLKQFAQEESGAAMVEYSILIGIITAAVIAIILGVGIYVKDQWTTLCTNLKTADSKVTGCP
jgi:pilus assembly protein Flp/PilA